jgi:hypothetical protein
VGVARDGARGGVEAVAGGDRVVHTYMYVHTCMYECVQLCSVFLSLPVCAHMYENIHTHTCRRF